MRKTYYRNLSSLSVSLLLGFSSLYSATALAAHSWEGPYMGAYVGGAVGDNKVSTDVGDITDVSYFASSANSDAVNHAGSYTAHPGSAIVGIQLGQNWVYKEIVYGVVFDYGALPLDSSDSTTELYPDGSGSFSTKTSMNTHWSFTLRGRVGYPTILRRWPSLLYVTGGMAIADVKVKNSFSDTASTAGVGESSHSQNQIGWTAGLGIELASSNNISVDLEYLYIQLPSVKTTGTISNTGGGFGIPVGSLNSTFSTTGKLRANLFKLGLNYRF